MSSGHSSEQSSIPPPRGSTSTSSSTSTSRKRSFSTATGSPSSAGNNKRSKADIVEELNVQIQRFIGQLVTYENCWTFLKNDPRPARVPHPWFLHPLGQLTPAFTMRPSLLTYSDDPKVKSIGDFHTKEPEQVIEYLRRNGCEEWPTYADLKEKDPEAFLNPYIVDVAKIFLSDLAGTREQIYRLDAELSVNINSKPTPSAFGKGTGWHDTQRSGVPLLCHRPGYNRPDIPLIYMHKAFEAFMTRKDLSDTELQEFRIAAEALSESLTAALEEEATRATEIAAIIERIFPNQNGYYWFAEKSVSGAKMDLIYRKSIRDPQGRVPGLEETYPYMNVIVIEIKLEEGASGDAFMQLARYFDQLVDDKPRYRDTGAPTFLITISGPNMKFCGGWSDPISKSIAVDVFETLFVCQDVAYIAREQLAHALCRLKYAIGLLPTSHVLPVNPEARSATDLPSVFETYKQFQGKAHTQEKFNVRLSRRLMPQVRRSVFLAYAQDLPSHVQEPPAQAAEGNCIAKLIYGDRYGVQVHRALEPEFAPILFGISESGAGASLLLMQFLFPPTETGEGWLPLENLGQEIKAANLPAISDTLDNLLEALRKEGYVHGDLRPINLMVAMANLSSLKVPVQIKALDFEWAGPVGKARYPTDRNNGLGYPGVAGRLIGCGDDEEMIKAITSPPSQAPAPAVQPATEPAAERLPYL